MTSVRILGGFQSDFARNITREGGQSADLCAEAVAGTLADAGVAPQDVGVIHVGNAFGQLFTGQGHLGAMPATVEPALIGVPAARHEAACASGGVALLAAMADLESGRYDVALVLGLELERTVSGTRAAELMAAAGWAGHEGGDAPYLWPWAFNSLADEYARRYGLDDADLRAIGRINLTNAADNPLAQTRGWALTEASFTADDTANPIVEGRLRRHDCSQVTDGAAGVVLVSDRYLRAHPAAADRATTIAGWGHRTAGLALGPKLAASEGDEYVLPQVRGCILDAFGRAGVADVWQLDAIETHDCFTPSEYMAIDHFGITAPGESWRAVREGWIARDGRLPINPGGGLIGTGHPVGATGVRMLLDAHRQVSGTAGACQVAGTERVGTLNIGGSTATIVSFVVERGLR